MGLVLIHFPLHEPPFVERNADVDAESIFCYEIRSRGMHPLRTDVQQRTVVVGVDDG